MKRKRKLDSFDYEGMRKWIYKMAWDNQWRVPAWMSIQDVIQEGNLVYVKCLRSFEATGPESHHKREFMAYFSRAFSNRINDMAWERSNTPEIAESSVHEDDEGLVQRWTETAAVLPDATLAAALVHAPTEVIEALQALVVDGKGVMEPYRYAPVLLVRNVLHSRVGRYMLSERRVRETTEQYYARCLQKRGVPALLRDYLVTDASPA